MKRALLPFSLLSAAALIAIGCAGSATVPADANDWDPNRSIRLSTTVAKAGAALVRNGDGTISFDTASGAYALLTDEELGVAQSLVDTANAKVARGEIAINADFTANDLTSGAKLNPKCKLKWYGGDCAFDATDAASALTDMSEGFPLTSVCNSIPVIGSACGAALAIEAVALEAELRPCVNRDDGANLHITWTSIGWFTCE